MERYMTALLFFAGIWNSPDFSNLQGKRKLVWEIGSSKNRRLHQITLNWRGIDWLLVSAQILRKNTSFLINVDLDLSLQTKRTLKNKNGTLQNTCRVESVYSAHSINLAEIICNNLLPLCNQETLVYDLRNVPGTSRLFFCVKLQIFEQFLLDLKLHILLFSFSCHLVFLLFL